VPSEIRQRFNVGRYWERAVAGEFQQVLRRDSHPSLENSTEPFCTRSQIVAYVGQNGERLAIVHQYLRGDGALGGAGRPDPKMLIDEGIAYYVLRPESDDR
jgi:hypothetical protein